MKWFHLCSDYLSAHWPQYCRQTLTEAAAVRSAEQPHPYLCLFTLTGTKYSVIAERHSQVSEILNYMLDLRCFDWLWGWHTAKGSPRKKKTASYQATVKRRAQKQKNDNKNLRGISQCLCWKMTVFFKPLELFLASYHMFGRSTN